MSFEYINKSLPMICIKNSECGGEEKHVGKLFSWMFCDQEDGLVEEGFWCCVGDRLAERVLYMWEGCAGKISWRDESERGSLFVALYDLVIEPVMATDA